MDLIEKANLLMEEEKLKQKLIKMVEKYRISLKHISFKCGISYLSILNFKSGKSSMKENNFNKLKNYLESVNF